MKRAFDRLQKYKLSLIRLVWWDSFRWYLISTNLFLLSVGFVACQPVTFPSTSSSTSIVTLPPNSPPKSAVTLLKPDLNAFVAILNSEHLTKDESLPDKTKARGEVFETELDNNVVTKQSAAVNARMNSIIWEFDVGEQETRAITPSTSPSENSVLTAEPDLTEDALEASFALLSGRVTRRLQAPVYEMLPKSDGVIRVGLLVPLSGKYKSLGTEIRRSVEMALFTINNPKIEVLFLDTKAGEEAGNAAMKGVESGVDIFIGPLFTKAVIHARAITDRIKNTQKIPAMLLLSNNVDVAGANSWLMGYLPEQQLDGLLGHAISKGKRKFALIAQDTVFGQRLLAHATRRLDDFGLEPEAVRVLSDEDLGDEKNLKTIIREFTRYLPAVDGTLLANSPFDAVVFAGDPAFALRTAPVLAYYDVGSDRALYLGNALWNQSQVLVEPSLQGGLFSMRPSNLDPLFDTGWNNIWADPAGQLARVGFDAMALVSALAKSDDRDWVKQLVRNSGFQGYSGAFRLLPNGHNIRSFELRKIENGEAKIIKGAPNKI